MLAFRLPCARYSSASLRQCLRVQNRRLIYFQLLVRYSLVVPSFFVQTTGGQLSTSRMYPRPDQERRRRPPTTTTTLALFGHPTRAGRCFATSRRPVPDFWPVDQKSRNPGGGILRFQQKKEPSILPWITSKYRKDRGFFSTEAVRLSRFEPCLFCFRFVLFCLCFSLFFVGGPFPLSVSVFLLNHSFLDRESPKLPPLRPASYLWSASLQKKKKKDESERT
jgi:hypothetical protein